MIDYTIKKIGDLDLIFAYEGRSLVYLDSLENEEFFRETFKGFDLNETEKDYGVADQVREYFAGKRKSFDLDIKLYGTDFQKKVWERIYQIPYGEKASYKEIAEDIGSPRAYRAVGTATGKNPIMIVIPCHRVFTSDGKKSGFRGGMELRDRLLRVESHSLS